MSASTIGTNDFCGRVRARWGTLLPLPLVARADHNIALCIFGGLERLARAIKDTADRHLLVREINATPAAGVIDLSTSTFDGVLIDTLKTPGAITTQADTAAVFKLAPSLDALRAKTPTDSDVVWYTLRGKKLHFKNPSTGSLTTYVTGLTLAASYIPALGDANRPLPDTLEDQAIDRVAEIVKQLGGLNFLKMDEDAAQAAISAIAKE